MMLLIRAIRWRALGNKWPSSIIAREDRVFLPRHISLRLVSQSTWYRSWLGITTDDDDFARTMLREQLPGAMCLSSRDHTRTLPFHREIKVSERAHSVRFQRGTLARSRNPAIAIDRFLRNLAVVTSWAAKQADEHDDDIRVRKKFVPWHARLKFVKKMSIVLRYRWLARFAGYQMMSDEIEVVYISHDANMRVLNSEHFWNV